MGSEPSAQWSVISGQCDESAGQIELDAIYSEGSEDTCRRMRMS